MDGNIDIVDDLLTGLDESRKLSKIMAILDFKHSRWSFLKKLGCK